jgi:Holliday junction resolvasome RuvABC endonuclease subunit
VIVIGIDPSIANPVGIVVYESAAECIIAAATARPDVDTTALARASFVASAVQEMVQQHHAELLVIEKPPMVKSARVHYELSCVVGAIGDRLRTLPLVEVTPQRAKSALAGRGNAPKSQMQTLALARFGAALRQGNQADREALADAAGVALAGFAVWQELQRELAA